MNIRPLVRMLVSDLLVALMRCVASPLVWAPTLPEGKRVSHVAGLPRRIFQDGAPEFDTNRRKYLICIGQAFQTGTTTGPVERR